MPFGPKGLVVTWSVPVPEEARVTYAGPEIFTAVDRVMGTEIPPDFPKEYLRDLKHVELFNAQMSFASNDLEKWEKRADVEMQHEPLEVFEKYFSTKHVVASTLVEHPTVSHPEKIKDACNIVLQRAVIFSNPDPGSETLYLRSYFHTTDDTGMRANFVPSGGMKIEFSSKRIWFPLELTRFISEPAAYVVLDILTPANFEAKSAEFKTAKTGKMEYQGKTYHVTRLTAKLAGGKEWKDLSLEP